MDIRSYVKAYVPPPTAPQFAVLAFDLGVEGPDVHPPEATLAEFSDLIDANSESGPWCVQPLEGWQPIADLSSYHFETEKRVQELQSGQLKVDRVGTLKKSERYNVTTWGDPEKIHAEALLMVPLAARVERYFLKWNQLPQSIALYSHFSPCPACVEYLEEARAKAKTFGGQGMRVAAHNRADVKSWFFTYDEPYLRDVERRPLPTESPFGTTKDGYLNPIEAREYAERLEIAGWTVLHP